MFFLAIILFRRFSSVSVRKAMIVGMVICGLLTFTLAGVTMGHRYIIKDELAVSSKSTKLRTGPNTRFEATAKISRGTRVRILGRQGKWVVNPFGNHRLGPGRNNDNYHSINFVNHNRIERRVTSLTLNYLESVLVWVDCTVPSFFPFMKTPAFSPWASIRVETCLPSYKN